ncbi:hypothetical protein C0Z18_06575 [Trinickia dabaoshanensis]|uniref:Uncharacterized protein n=1 Tax=Trinickia dabaoshanensis TaxID=564714 RepID=A0A2N7VYD4_9BURK|nr:hypothetical protein [Trinickia dabaoshanensis]PMS22161.1 hypothetical protein C0Z18_06575 [Trinickia dabaoshanensis]
MRRKLPVVALFFAEICSDQFAFGQLTIAVKHEVLSVDMGQPGCVISVVDYFDGHLASRMKMTAGYWTDVPPVQSTLGDFGIRFKCRIGQQFDDAAQKYGAQWDEGGRIWKLYDEDASDRKLLRPVSKIYQLKSPNATGFLRTTDEISGDENQRVRFYSFCLFHEKAAVCGEGQSMKLKEPKGDYLPAILRILRGVSFVDYLAGGNQ